MNAPTGGVRRLLKAEGLAVAALSVCLYYLGGYSWGLFGLLLLAPDLSFAGYLTGARAGAIVYNALHSYVGPAAVAAVLLLDDWPPAVPLIWAAHIGIDRALGYGLKYAAGFHETHLGRIGRGVRVARDR